ncbi:hypothetical protein F5888DRAFT_1868223 [Russula emetica]|nr:hypothetical protein F5888DRAFT_1868223 [Russula emetica]
MSLCQNSDQSQCHVKAIRKSDTGDPSHVLLSPEAVESDMCQARFPRAPIQTTEHHRAALKAPGILPRHSVNQPMMTGIKPIDAMVPIGHGQCHETDLAPTSTLSHYVCLVLAPYFLTSTPFAYMTYEHSTEGPDPKARL